MKKILFILISCVMFSTSTMAVAANQSHDVTTDPKSYFLKTADVADSITLLPPPPSEDSAEFANDKAIYQAGKAIRNTPRGKQAAQDTHIEGDGIAQLFSDSFGFKIDKKTTPEILKLLINIGGDAGDLATRAAKQHYMRTRPFVFYNEATCDQTDEKALSKNGSYPSGHTSDGWASALVLAEINPARQNEILKRGYEIGQSRAICGYHWQSDVNAGRIVGSAVVAKLHSNSAFIKQLNKAKAEMAKLSK